MLSTIGKRADGKYSNVTDLHVLSKATGGATRRATSMIPIAFDGSVRELVYTSAVRFHQLLVSLEGNQRSGCLRIVSQRRKARSAILIYRGRVVGCLYGQRKLGYHFLEKEAHKLALADLASPGNILDAYELPEDIVLAEASVFSGQVLQIPHQDNPQGMLYEAMKMVCDMELPGCAVVSTVDDEMICMVYMSGGRIIGLYCARQGWVKPNYEDAVRYLSNDKPTKVQASFLPFTADQQTSSIGFSLTGLADIVMKARQAKKAAIQEVNYLYPVQAGTHIYSHLPPGVTPRPPQPGKPRVTAEYVSTVPSHNTFAITP